jgi:cellulose synthase/poly-beta-1,6-N-acetylglucosamine synthase-like glycosyltransferase
MVDPIDFLGIMTWGVVAVAMVGLLVFVCHSLCLLALFRRYLPSARVAERLEAVSPLPNPGHLPRILVQLPVYNERDVVVRVIEAACQLQWPNDRLVIQVLDDSTDDTSGIAADFVKRQQNRGVAIQHLHRIHRKGFKAGALQAGLQQERADYVAIFDADFIPPKNFLTRAIRPMLTDTKLAFVQGRWDHLNPRQNAITRAQAVGLDSHFFIEQSARAWCHLPMHFNGTCGLWRCQAIQDAGGWHHDTLTEDIDLSYRAQLAGYHCTYRTDLVVPGELPETIDAWRNQQFRWAKGSIQVARKLLPAIWRAPWTLWAKLTATLHLTHYAANPLVILTLIAVPLALWLYPERPPVLVALGGAVVVLGCFTSFTLYAQSQRILRGANWKRVAKDLPVVTALGTGLSISNTRGVLEALTGMISPFVRTPKRGSSGGSYRAVSNAGLPECLAALWALWGQLHGLSMLTPLLLMFASGFAWVGVMSLLGWWQARSVAFA